MMSIKFSLPLQPLFQFPFILSRYHSCGALKEGDEVQISDWLIEVMRYNKAYLTLEDSK